MRFMLIWDEQAVFPSKHRSHPLDPSGELTGFCFVFFSFENPPFSFLGFPPEHNSRDQGAGWELKAKKKKMFQQDIATLDFYSCLGS